MKKDVTMETMMTLMDALHIVTSNQGPNVRTTFKIFRPNFASPLAGMDYLIPRMEKFVMTAIHSQTMVAINVK